MKRALTWLVAIALLLAIGIWGLVRWAQPPEALQAMPAWPVMVPAKAADIVLLASGPTPRQVHLARHGKSWQVQDGKVWKPADDRAVEDMLGTLANMRPDRVVTRNPAHYAELRVGKNADRITVKGKNGSVMMDLLVGRPGPDLVSTYVRQKGKQAVLSVGRSLGWQVRQSLDGWLKKKPQVPKDKPAAEAATGVTGKEVGK